MLKIGITGGIGSGKSIVSKILISMNYPVFNSDIEAKKIIVQNPFVKEQLITSFGSEVYINDSVNKVFLANIIFNDDKALEKINSIIHPEVRKAFKEYSQSQSSKLVFNEAAILFESDSYKDFDRIILITSPEELRIKRVMNRDNVDREAVISRMEKQWKDEQKIPLSDYQVTNDELVPLLKQVEAIIEDLERL